MNRILQLFDEGVRAINVGIEFFKDDILGQGGVVAQVDWPPPGFAMAAAPTVRRPG